MNTLADIDNIRAVDVRIEEDMFYVKLEDGRDIGVPYDWYWRLAGATAEQRRNWRFISGGYGIHWEEIDEDISVAGIIMGRKNPTPPAKLTHAQPTATTTAALTAAALRLPPHF